MFSPSNVLFDAWLDSVKYLGSIQSKNRINRLKLERNTLVVTVLVISNNYKTFSSRHDGLLSSHGNNLKHPIKTSVFVVEIKVLPTSIKSPTYKLNIA